MTETEWMAAADPTQMLLFLWHRASERTLRLFACSVHRGMSHFNEAECVVAATELSERYADGLATAEELREARVTAVELWSTFHSPNVSAARHPRGLVTGAACQVTRLDVTKVVTEIEQVAAAGGVEGRERARLMRDIFGNPFRPVTLDPAWLTEAVVALARGIYEDRAFDRMPVLADALEDAGCSDPDILNHCRGEGPHVRGCHVLDLLLGKT
jgi:hypothetical protein